MCGGRVPVFHLPCAGTGAGHQKEMWHSLKAPCQAGANQKSVKDEDCKGTEDTVRKLLRGRGSIQEGFLEEENAGEGMQQ